MSELFDAREQSHAIRSQDTYTVYIGDNGASYTAPPPPPGLLSKAGDVALAAGEAVVDAAMDPVGTAKATGRAVAGGLRDTMQGVVDLSAELGGIIETKVGSLGYLTIDENGVNYSKEPPAGAQPGQLGDLPDVAKGDSMAEGLARGLVQFGAGMAVAPIRGAGMGVNMLRSGFADALLNPEEGNLSSLLKGMGIDHAVIDFLDSKVEGDAGPEERLKARFLQAVEGTGIGIPIDVVMAGFRLIRSNKEAVETVRETLAQAPPPTDTQVMPDQSFFDKAGEATDKFVTPAATTADEMATDAALATDNTVFPDATDKFITQAATTTDEMATDAALATDKFVSPDAADKFVTQAAATTDEVAANAALATDKFVSKVEPPTDDTPGIIAFHGSAADFDGFKLEKIGTGEGAQAYGYGLYFADKEDIAKFYRDALREEKNIIQYNGKPLNSVYTQDVEDVFLDDIEATFQEAERIGIPVDRDDVVTVFSQLGQGLGSLSDARAAVDSLSPSFGSGTNRYLNFYDMVLSKKLEIPDIKGRVYKVGLTPKPDDLLDYDKPFSEQTPAIQAALEKAGYKTERNMVVKEDGDNRFGVYETNDDGTEILLKHFTEPMLFKGPLEKQAQDFIVEQNAELLNNNGAQILDVLASGIAQKGLHLPGGKKKDAERLASDALFKAGIPGIKYLDNTSRDGAGTSNNYVIFDDSMINILEKYGIVGPVAISAAAASKGGQKDDET